MTFLCAQDPSLCNSVECLKHLVVTKDVRRDTVAAEEKGEGDGGSTTCRIRRRFDLAKISRWLNEGRYTRLQQLQDDLLAVFKLGRAVYGSETYRESFKLERTYLKVRDEVCKNGTLLQSQALEYTARYGVMYCQVCVAREKILDLWHI